MTAIDVRLDATGAPPEERITGLAALDERMDSLHAVRANGDPTIVVVFTHGLWLDIGLGASRSFVQVQPEAGEGPCFVTVGDAEASGVTTFLLHDEHHTEIPNSNLVAIATVREIVRSIVRTGARPTTVEWEQLF